RVRRLRARIPAARAELVVLPAVVLPPPSAGLDARDRRRLPTRARHQASLGARAGRLRARLRRRLRRPLLRPGSRAGVRTPVAARRTAAPMRRAIVLVSLFALVAPAAAFAHASVRATQPSYRQRLEQQPRTAWVRFDQAVKALPNSIVVRSAKGKVVSGVTRNGTDPHLIVAPLE